MLTALAIMALWRHLQVTPALPPVPSFPIEPNESGWTQIVCTRQTTVVTGIHAEQLEYPDDR